LRLVSLVAVHRLPRDERAGGLGEPEETLAVLVPCRAEVGLLDRRERGLLGTVIGIEAARLVLVPAPRGAIDGRSVGDTQVGGETLKIRRARVLWHDSMVCRVHARTSQVG